jgi:hypothetical protein
MGFSSKQSAETTRGSVDPLRVMCGAPKVLNLVRFARDATFGHSSYSTWPSSSKYPSEYVDIVIIIYVQELDKEVESLKAYQDSLGVSVSDVGTGAVGGPKPGMS